MFALKNALIYLHEYCYMKYIFQFFQHSQPKTIQKLSCRFNSRVKGSRCTCSKWSMGKCQLWVHPFTNRKSKGEVNFDKSPIYVCMYVCMYVCRPVVCEFNAIDFCQWSLPDLNFYFNLNLQRPNLKLAPWGEFCPLGVKLSPGVKILFF
jgi:hypothetical protein